MMEEIIAKKEQWIRDNMVEGLSLAILTDHSDPASEIYMRNKIRACEKFGIQAKTYTGLGQGWDYEADGVLVQLPTKDPILQTLSTDVGYVYDVDAFGSQHVEELYHGKPKILPCTVQSCMDIIEHRYPETVRGLNVLIIGRSELVGKPLAVHLINLGATVTVANSQTDLDHYFDYEWYNWDIIVSATGQHGVIKNTNIDPSTLCIDVGICRVDGKVVGDVQHVMDLHQPNITPVPGGVGRLTVLNVIYNLIKLQDESHV